MEAVISLPGLTFVDSSGISDKERQPISPWGKWGAKVKKNIIIAKGLASLKIHLESCTGMMYFRKPDHYALFTALFYPGFINNSIVTV